MKNKIEFSENETIQTRQFINHKSDMPSFGQNQYSNSDKNQSIKSFKSPIKGKVKICNKNNRTKFINNIWTDEETELEIVSKRMFLFLKFISLFSIAISLFILYKKNILVI